MTNDLWNRRKGPLTETEAALRRVAFGALTGDADTPRLVGSMYGCEVWAWDGCPMVNAGADREGLYVGERTVRVVSDA